MEANGGGFCDAGSSYADAAAGRTINYAGTGYTIPGVSFGANDQPRQDNPVPWGNWNVSAPELWGTQLTQHVTNGIQWCQANPLLAEANAILIYAWNEHAEAAACVEPLLNPDGSANTTNLDAVGNAIKMFDIMDPGPPKWNLNVPGPVAWTNANYWRPNTAFPNAVDGTANINNNITVDNVISLNAPVTLGTLNIGDSGTGTDSSFTITGSGGSLTFDVSSNSAAISKTGGGADTISATITLNDNVICTMGPSSGGLTVSGNISENGAAKTLTKEGGTTLTLSGTNTFSGGVTVNAGPLNINSATALGTGTNIFNVGTTIIDNTSSSDVVMTANNPQIWKSLMFTGTHSLDLGKGAVTLTVATTTVTVNGSTLTVGGPISGTGAKALTKAGGGTLALGGTNTYTGATTINAGKLRLTGSLASGSKVAVNVGGSLDGTGTAAGAVTNNSGGTITAGADGIGTLKTGSLSLNSGSTNLFEFAVDGSTNDMIDASAGTLTITNGVLISLYNVGTTNSFTTPGIYNLIKYGTLIGTTSTLTVANAQVGRVYAFDTQANWLRVTINSTAPNYTLTVYSPYGIPNPSTGAHTFAQSTVLTNSVSNPNPQGFTQYVCRGWAMTGHEPATGVTTNFPMTVTNDATLTWLWKTNFWLESSAGPHGAVAPTNSWQAFGTNISISATNDLFYHFTTWSGSAVTASNPLPLLMNSPKSVQANFAANLATHGTPQWWLANYGISNNLDVAETNDPDTDGMATWQEYLAGTNPKDSNSVFKIIDMTFSGGSNRLVWLGGNTNLPPFLVLRSTNLADISSGWDWTTSVSRSAVGTNIWTDAGIPGFYRILATNSLY
jgi:autotransporter-associated beta strand protein